MGSENGADKMEQLQHLTERAITINAAVADKILRQPAKQAQENVAPTTAAEKPWQEPSDPNQQAAQSMGAPRQQVPMVPATASPMV